MNYHRAPASPVGVAVTWGEDAWPKGGACGRAPPVFLHCHTPADDGGTITSRLRNLGVHAVNAYNSYPRLRNMSFDFLLLR